jgi:hypothetical protein
VLANAPAEFAGHATFTYHARVAESDGDEVARRNRALVQRAKADLNRFLACVGREVGRLVWIQEFQKRGAIHFHALFEHAVDERRLAVAWCRATDQLHDPHALAHAVKVRKVEDQIAARKYLIRYFGKGVQKQLPAGVDRAGRFWGASRSLRVGPVAEVVTCPAKYRHHDKPALGVIRAVRRFLSGELGFKYRGGRLVFWDAAVPERLLGVVRRLRVFYRDEGYLKAMLEPFWEGADSAVVQRMESLNQSAEWIGEWV